MKKVVRIVSKIMDRFCLFMNLPCLNVQTPNFVGLGKTVLSLENTQSERRTDGQSSKNWIKHSEQFCARNLWSELFISMHYILWTNTTWPILWLLSIILTMWNPYILLLEFKTLAELTLRATLHIIIYLIHMTKVSITQRMHIESENCQFF